MPFHFLQPRARRLIDQIQFIIYIFCNFIFRKDNFVLNERKGFRHFSPFLLCITEFGFCFLASKKVCARDNVDELEKLLQKY